GFNQSREGRGSRVDRRRSVDAHRRPSPDARRDAGRQAARRRRAAQCRGVLRPAQAGGGAGRAAGGPAARASRCPEAGTAGRRTCARFHAPGSGRTNTHAGIADGAERPDAGVLPIRRLVTYCKTQLVELQGRRQSLTEQGIGLAAVSYDPVPVLSEFAARRGIQFPLLSDPGSATIRTYGIFNTAIPETNQQAYG